MKYEVYTSVENELLYKGNDESEAVEAMQTYMDIHYPTFVGIWQSSKFFMSSRVSVLDENGLTVKCFRFRKNLVFNR